MSSHPTLVFNLVTEAVKENYGKKGLLSSMELKIRDIPKTYTFTIYALKVFWKEFINIRTQKPHTKITNRAAPLPLSNSYRQTHAQLNPLIRTYRESVLFLLVAPLYLCIA